MIHNGSFFKIRVRDGDLSFENNCNIHLTWAIKVQDSLHVITSILATLLPCQ